MTRLAFRSPVTTRLWPHTAPLPPVGEFRVTQRFASPDFYWSNQPNPPSPLPTHGAVDIGNRRCNDPIVAMAPGMATRIKDNATTYGAPNDALGVRIDHGSGITTEYWHLNGWTIPTGPVWVSAGQQVGILGSTGLGQVCHCHIEVKRNGVKFDPEPLMFGGSIEIGDDVKLPGKFLRHVQNRRGAVTADAQFREGVTTGADGSLGVIPKGTVLYPIVVVEGRPAGTAVDQTEWYGALAYVGGTYQLGFIHSSLWPRSADGKSVSLERVEEAADAQNAALERVRAGVGMARIGVGNVNAALEAIAKAATPGT